jgi:hypothetical protein
MEFCLAMWDEFKLKKVKRKFQPNPQQVESVVVEANDVTDVIIRKSIGKATSCMMTTSPLNYIIGIANRFAADALQNLQRTAR